jgi:VanZ family protein
MHDTRWDAGWKRRGIFQGLYRFGGERHLRWGCCLGLAAYVVALALATHCPPRHFPRWPFRIDVPDKLAHFVAYALLAVLVVITALTFGAARRLRPWHWAALAGCGLLVLAALGLCDEMTQPIVGRQFDWLDWAADLAGAATAAVLAAIYLPIQNRLKMRSRISSV